MQCVLLPLLLRVQQGVACPTQIPQASHTGTVRRSLSAAYTFALNPCKSLDIFATLSPVSFAIFSNTSSRSSRGAYLSILRSRCLSC
ncbi:uncharacterized protein EV422DRAFT_539880 [Fimicolochytrium jonesii]|uniref:uncharacterized protein n=1 Tax=Fimicolochytrium jonesii TaxID=1396493 RepID=UPI0022FE6F0A|nr:uncharacterized protein EV422DRAFT_539880 [Fimicolochytrium jonesii]KAI8817770.1 hypothetical protein EV422DRAFT_539880 [Fimicolochytrium jonesii]